MSEMLMPIHRAIKQGNTAEMARLIGDDNELLCLWTPFGTWLQDAASCGGLEAVLWLVARGLDVNAYNDSNESPPLCKAAARGHVEIARYLLSAGATLDVSNSVRNPLLSAIVGGLSDSHTAVAKLLIDAGIDTTIRYPNLDNMDAFEYAREWGRSEIVALLEAKSR